MMEEHGVAGARPDLALAPLGRLRRRRRRRPVLAGARPENRSIVNKIKIIYGLTLTLYEPSALVSQELG